MLLIQKSLIATKDKNAGRYKYRSAEDLFEKIKPLLTEPLSVTTDLVDLAGKLIIKATVRYKDMQSCGFCEVENTPKNMSVGQAYGAATSYAVKYAICMLFCVDNGEDLDGRESIKKENWTIYDQKKELHGKLIAAGMKEKEMKDFYNAYCPNELSIENVLKNLDSFLEEWDKTGVKN